MQIDCQIGHICLILYYNLNTYYKLQIKCQILLVKCHKTTRQIDIGTLTHKYYENHNNQMFIKCQVRAIISKYGGGDLSS